MNEQACGDKGALKPLQAAAIHGASSLVHPGSAWARSARSCASQLSRTFGGGGGTSLLGRSPRTRGYERILYPTAPSGECR